MSEKDTKKQTAKEKYKKAEKQRLFFALKALVVIGIMMVFVDGALNNGLNTKFNEIIDDCMTNNEHIAYHPSGDSRIEYMIECKVTVFRGVPVEFNGGE